MIIEPWIWAVLLLVLGMGLAVLEVFFPSAGILGFLAATSFLAAIIVGFRSDNPAVGFLILATFLRSLPYRTTRPSIFWASLVRCSWTVSRAGWVARSSAPA